MKVEFDSGNFQDAVALVGQWPERARAVQKQFLYRAVSKVYHDVLGLMPSDRRELRRSLRMQRIRGLSDKADGYLIRSIPKGAAVTKSEDRAVVLYVARRTGLMIPIPEATSILEKYSPWTIDTLPYAPDPKTATVISRKVSPREVVKVRKLRKRDRPAWRQEMDTAGIRTSPSIFQPRPNQVGAIPDTAFESLRLEFGLGGEPSKPHWRRAILGLARRGGTGMIARKREFTRAMTDASFQSWKAWPRKLSGFATVAEAKRYMPFQKRMGLRVTR